jgi:hypothetical protein
MSLLEFRGFRQPVGFTAIQPSLHYNSVHRFSGVLFYRIGIIEFFLQLP